MRRACVSTQQHVTRPFQCRVLANFARSFHSLLNCPCKVGRQVSATGPCSGVGILSKRGFSGPSSDSIVVAMGHRVTVTYKAAFEEGLVFDDGKDPITLICGDSGMVTGFHRGIVGMRVGETREITVTPADGFGERDNNKIGKIPASKLPAGVNVGSRLSLGQNQGEATVIVLNDDYAGVDLNHPLAGKSITFTVTLLSCEELPKQDHLIVETTGPGDGSTYPQHGDRLTMHYTGTIAGSQKIFDCSRTRGEAFVFNVGVKQVIEGWDEGVMQLSLGERAIIRVPSAKGYGSKGCPPVIPPDADLVFDVELLKIN